MFKLQQQLNDATNGENWEDGVTKNGKSIDWKRCIYMECAEMVDSFAWKHWKNISDETDWDNLKIECVDVWHFVMSLMLQEYKVNNFGSLEDILKSVESMQSYIQLQNESSTCSDNNLIMEKIELVMFDVLNKDELVLKKLLKDFFELCVMCGLDFDELYQLYVGKNILNQFRQDHGYKDGTYIKVWNGDEDNVVMQKLFKENSSITPQELYAKLKSSYSDVS
jgi:dimeric dUTPase (all-alpha-NTP-PPase superfamily)